MMTRYQSSSPEPCDAYASITSGRTIWQADGCGARPTHLFYRESFRAVYAGIYTNGRAIAWDGLKSNCFGMIRNDFTRGFDLTMRAGDAERGSYTGRDLASAPHGEDYRPHYADWQRDPAAHPNLLLPGRTAIWHGARFDVLRLGNDIRGTGGCCIQDWRGIEFLTMERHRSTTKAAEYFGAGLCFFPEGAMLPRLTRAVQRFQRPGPFGTPIPGVAPIYAMAARMNGFLAARILHIDPDIPHEFACHWSPDAQEITLWLDGERVLAVRDRAWAIPIGVQTGGRAKLRQCALHLDAWQDNGSGNMVVTGADGHQDRDQVFTVERLEIQAVTV